MHRNTFGRTLILGFTVSASSIATGSEPWASPLPILDGKSKAETPGV